MDPHHPTPEVPVTELTLWILDRIEEDLAVLVAESGEQLEIPSHRLPPEVREGHALREREGAWEIDREATLRLREEIGTLRASLRRGPSGRLSL